MLTHSIEGGQLDARPINRKPSQELCPRPACFALSNHLPLPALLVPSLGLAHLLACSSSTITVNQGG